jgi:hypothetical protein
MMGGWRLVTVFFYQENVIKNIFCKTVFRSRENGVRRNIQGRGVGNLSTGTPALFLPHPLFLPPFPVSNHHKTAVRQMTFNPVLPNPQGTEE